MQHGSDGGDDRTQQHGHSDVLLGRLTAQVNSSLLATDLYGVITCFNRGAELLLGYRASELIGRDTAAIFPTTAATYESRTGFTAEPSGSAEFAILSGLAAESGTWRGERTLNRKDGTQLPLQLCVTVMLDGSGTPSGYLCIAQELTAKLALAPEQEADRELLNATIEAMPHPFYLKNPDGTYINCNSRFADFLGLNREHIIGKNAGLIASRSSWADGLVETKGKEFQSSRGHKQTVHRAGGASAVLLFKEVPLLGSTGLEFGTAGSILDITGQTRIEEELQHQATRLEEKITKYQRVERELKESEERLRVIFEASQAGIILVGPDGIISFANRRMAEMFGVGIDELLGSRYGTWLHPTDKHDGAILAASLGNGEVSAVNVERHYQRRDGSDFWGYLSGRRLENDDGTLRALVGSIADVTALKNSQSALEREKERLTVTLRSIGDGVITVDTDGRVVLLNRAAEGLCGYRQAEAAGLPLDQVFRVLEERTGTPKQNSIARALVSGVVVEESGIGMLVSRDGTERIIVSKTAPILDRDRQIPGAVLVFSDITERREIEEELFKARKLESLGILAGGIAHDFNNLLTGIMGNISLSRAQLSESHQAATFLERARKGSEQAKELTLQLLTFSKGGAPIKKLTSITQVLTDSALFALRGSNVRCDFDIDPDLWRAEIDTGQMSQVISNLVINADQAMPEGGTILIRAENVLPLEESDHDRRIRITFKDTGIGISEEDVSRIYDPYFSTKATGSGLGLATVYAIIKNHDGEIRVFSRLKHGTTFAITLPAQEGNAPEEALSDTPLELETTAGGGKILLMDDEDAIREMAAAALSMFGYQPEVACDGEEMLQMYRQAQESGAPFDAVIMDLTVPGGMGGKEAVRKLLELHPQALAIASSGYSEDTVMANYRDYGFAGIVSKPYSLQELDDTLKEILARALN